MALYLLWHVSLHLCTQQQATERFSVCTNTHPTTVQSVQLKRAPKEDIHSKIPKECLLLTDKVNEERKYYVVIPHYRLHVKWRQIRVSCHYGAVLSPTYSKHVILGFLTYVLAFALVQNKRLLIVRPI